MTRIELGSSEFESDRSANYDTSVIKAPIVLNQFVSLKLASYTDFYISDIKFINTLFGYRLRFKICFFRIKSETISFIDIVLKFASQVWLCPKENWSNNH